MKKSSSGIDRVAWPRRRCSVVPSAIRAGIVSPIGEPLAMLPPSVPTARTCLAPRRRKQLDEIGIDRRHGAFRALIGDAGADTEARFGLAHVRQTVRPPQVNDLGRARICLVIHSPTSVAPATSVASGCRA